MDAQLLKKMEQWHVTISLMGLTHEQMFEEECYDEYDGLREALTAYLSLQKRINNPKDMVMKAVMQTIAMEVDDDDIADYDDHLQNIERQKEEAEAQKLIDDKIGRAHV